MKFIHFRVQSSYSMLESALTIDNICSLAKSKNMPAICLSDRGNLFGSLEFALAAIKIGIQPIHGSTLNLLLEDESFAEILLIAKDEVGYKNLLKLVSYTFTKNDRKICNHISMQDLRNHHEGLIVLSSYVEGGIGKYLLQKDYDKAYKLAEEFKKFLDNRFYFEISRHNLENERLIENSYTEIAEKLEIPLLATNNVLFKNISDHDAHDVLLCISSGTTKGVEERRRVSNQCYFKSAGEMIELFKDLPEAVNNTYELAQRCFVMSKTHSPMLPNFSKDGISEEDVIRDQTYAGLNAKLEQKFAIENVHDKDKDLIKEEYFRRVDYELSIICSMNFSGYFLIVSDFIKWSKQQSIAVGPGRGSGAGSIVAWSLEITDLDPIKFGLLFERFLNPERISMPDFDIDFCQERREEVIRYVRQKYGDSKVGQIITFGKLQAKAVIKDVARVLSLPYKFADHLTELIPFNAVNPVTLKQAITEVAELNQAYRGGGLYNLDGEKELTRQVLETALILEGLHRHASVHAAGVVIAGENLIDVVPVYRDINSTMLTVQYSMKYADLAGLMKFDFLGLQTLTVITKCLKLLKDKKIYLDLNSIHQDDPTTYNMLSKGLGIGVFQFESAGMRDTLRRLKPDCLEEIIAIGALYRPGPMDNIPTYISCKHGKLKPDYLHPLLKPVLEETYGVIIYQEQVMEIAKILAGYTLGSADILRKAMGKKTKSEMDAQEEIFINGSSKNGIATDQAKSIFATLAKFASYGFNKAHASAYGVISYQTAYLKANYPAPFLVASLNLDIHDNDKVFLFLEEAKVFNINVISPDINISSGLFEVDYNITKDSNYSIIFALGAIKNVTPIFGFSVAEERLKGGKFRSVVDFLERMAPKSINKRLFENLIKSGCFDTLHSNRKQLLESQESLLSYQISYHKEKLSNQISLIDISNTGENLLSQVELKMSNYELAHYEFEVFGFYLKHHPLMEYKNHLKTQLVISANEIIDKIGFGSNQVKLAGVILKKDSRMSSRGKFIVLKISDLTGTFDVTIFSDEILKEFSELIELERAVIIECDVFKDEGGARIIAKSFINIENDYASTQINLILKPKNYEELIS